MKKNFLFNSAAALTLGLAAAGCSSEMPVYQGVDLQETASESFPVDNIDPNQTWEMCAYRTANISVAGDASKSYDIYVFTQLPTTGVATPTLAATKGVTGGATLQLSFDVAKAQETVYVARNGDDGFLIKPVTLSNDSYTADFSVNAVRSRAFSDKTSEMSGNPFSSVTAPVDADFKTSAPTVDDTAVFSNLVGYKTGTNYSVVYTEGTYDNVELQGTPSAIYISGNVTFTGKTNLYTCTSSTLNIYVLPNSSLTIDVSTGKLQNKETNIYVAKENGVLTLKGSLFGQNGNMNVYNRGTLNLSDGTIGSNAMVYNEGELTASKLLYNAGAASTYRGMLINKGTAKVTGDVTMTSNCSLLNDNYMYVGGSVTANQSSIWFVNTGNLTVEKDMATSASNKTFYNGCQVWVKGTLDLNDGEFNMLSDGAFYCSYMSLHNSKVNMNARSAVYVENTLNCYNKGDGIFQGFAASEAISSENDRAIVYVNGDVTFYDINDKSKVHTDKEALKLTGYLIFSAANSNDAFWNTELWQNAYRCTYDSNVSLTVPEGVYFVPNASADNKCLDWGPKGNTTVETQDYAYTYGFEDMTQGACDYDLNDVVLYVTTPDANGEVTVTLKAAGATLPITVKYKKADGTVVDVFSEVHGLFGVETTTMVNTGNGTTESDKSITATVNIGANKSLADYGDFYIVVTENGEKREIHVPEYTQDFDKGDVPYGLRVPTEWAWPTERTKIGVGAYSGFAAWAQDISQNQNWYETVDGSVYKK